MSDIGCISIDVDTLSSIYKGEGCTRAGGYTFVEFRSGVENMLSFFEKFGIHTTMFMVGSDFLYKDNHDAINAIRDAGHEIANHSMSHPQGFRFLSLADKRKELINMGDICESVTGIRPKGFRSPGWNIDDSAIPVFKDLDYIYDSSVFPTFLMPLMKFSHWASMSLQPSEVRTAMGQINYMFAPRTPFRVDENSLAKPGSNTLIEFPLSVSPVLRIPFFATLLLFTGNKLFDYLYRNIRSAGLPIHFQMHLSDFIDYSIPELEDQIPTENKGVYVPQALSTPLQKKMDIFSRMVEMMVEDYAFITLEEWSRRIAK